jgi:hypothetical protein
LCSTKTTSSFQKHSYARTHAQPHKHTCKLSHTITHGIQSRTTVHIQVFQPDTWESTHSSHLSKGLETTKLSPSHPRTYPCMHARTHSKSIHTTDKYNLNAIARNTSISIHTNPIHSMGTFSSTVCAIKYTHVP